MLSLWEGWASLYVFERKNKIINLITNIGVVNQINEPEWKDQPVINKWELAQCYLQACEVSTWKNNVTGAHVFLIEDSVPHS